MECRENKKRKLFGSTQYVDLTSVKPYEYFLQFEVLNIWDSPKEFYTINSEYCTYLISERCISKNEDCHNFKLLKESDLTKEEINSIKRYINELKRN